MMMFARKTDARVAFPALEEDLMVSFNKSRLERDITRIGDSFDRYIGRGIIWRPLVIC